MAKKKEWKEGEIALVFGLEAIQTYYTPLMNDWLNVEMPLLTASEQPFFEEIYQKALIHVKTWAEEDLKMKFISPILYLGRLMDDTNFVSMFDKSLSATVKKYKLSVKPDFVIGSGLMNYMQKPYFHFQEYKPNKNPTGDSMAQLLEAFLIAQEKNADGKPLYGCEVVGDTWRFVTMEDTTYCVSRNYDSTDRNELLQIIAILRHFRHILETVLLK
jgi:hypothetical protein